MKRLLTICLFFCSMFLCQAQTKLRVAQDSVTVVNAELVIGNSSKNVKGYLVNKGNGTTEFRSEKNIQFTVGGSSNMPQPGDTSYTSAAFINAHIKAWRNGAFQYRSNENGIMIDSASGKIIFYPALSQGDRIFIESSGIVDFELGNFPSFATNLMKLNSGIFDNKNSTFTLRWATNNTTLSSSPRVVGLGSSTLAGYGLSAPNRLGDKITSWLGSNTTAPTWINLAVAGYTSASILSQSSGGTAGHNIDTALAANPDFIFISVPSNDASAGISVAQTLANFREIDAMSSNNGVPVFFETSQPRTGYTSGQQQQLKQIADSVRKIWPDRYIEGFSNLVDNSAPTAAVLLSQYDNGDGTHLNSAGNQQIANSLFTRWQSYFQSVTGVLGYVVETSADSNTWTSFDQVQSSTIKKTYTRTDSAEHYYRVKAEYMNGQQMPFSNVVKLNAVEPALTIGNRLLIDFGGDGINTVNGSSVPDGKLTPSPDSLANYWNNWIGSGGSVGFVNGSSIDNLRTTNGALTPISVTLEGNPAGTFASTTKAINYNGFTTGVNDYPHQSMYDNMFVHSSNPSGVILKIKGLDPGKVYSIKLWGARRETTATNRILESQIGSEVYSFNSSYATSTAADYNRANVFDYVTGSDSVSILLKAKPPSSFAHVSILDIQISAPPTGGPVISAADMSSTLPNDSLQLVANVAANGTNITSYKWAQLIGPGPTVIANNTSILPTVRNLTNGIYSFRLTVKTAEGHQVVKDMQVTVYPNNEGKKTLRVHFSKTVTAPIPGWTNIASNVSGTSVNATDPVTSWSINNGGANNSYWKSYLGSNAASDAGHTTGDNSGVVPDIALIGYWFNYQKTFSADTSNLDITGLNPAKTYTLKLVGSRSSTAAAPRYSLWYISNNATPIITNVWGNTAAQTVLTNVAPDANGKIKIGVYASSNTATHGEFSYINALIVQEN